jgi:hypothetical protein
LVFEKPFSNLWQRGETENTEDTFILSLLAILISGIVAVINTDITNNYSITMATVNQFAYLHKLFNTAQLQIKYEPMRSLFSSS